ncbi:MAG: sulfatase-like hydrolase/transferase [Myxococcota bacterium]|nr:sulfatase-like hydrolase/transferase [Myxococcota bacterium]
MVLAGAVTGLGFFGLEAGLILRGESVGLRVDLRGPLAAFFGAVRPQLPGLLGRIALLYLAGGVVLALSAVGLAWLLGLRTVAGRGLAAVAEAWVLLCLLVAWKAVHRPALFDDLAPLSPLLGWLVDRVQPGQVVAVAVGWGALHLGAWLIRSPVRLPGKTLWVAGAGVLLVAWASVGTGPVPAPPAHPLLILIGVDAFRPDRLTALGSARQVAPVLDGFVSSATLFTNAHTPIAQTEPAWRSLLTARWPQHTGVRYPLTPDREMVPLPTFPQRLGEAGYQTVFHTDCSRFHFEGPASGFAARVQPPRGAINFLLEKLRFRGVGVLGDHRLGAWLLPELIDNRAVAGIHDPLGYADRLADDWVSRARRGPALLAFHATAAHFPGDPVYPFYRRFVPVDQPLRRRLRMVYAPIGADPASNWTREGTEALYDELLSQADAQVGILLDRLRRAGLYDRATIVVFSDHGESFHASHPALAGATPVHGARLQEEENRILLAVKLPHQQRPARVDSLVRLIDVGPTLLELAGSAPLSFAEGLSLLPLLRGEAVPPRLLYAETGFTHALPSAFDPGHLVGAPRAFEAYALGEAGVVEMSPAAALDTLREKDTGAYDGRHWLIRSPQSDGTVQERCTGDCDRLRAFLATVSPPPHSPPQVGTGL